MPKRTEQFVRADGYSYSSNVTLDLINSANALMLGSAGERSPKVFTNVDNHASYFAPGAIVLGVMAFELFLKYMIVGEAGRTDAEIQKTLERNAIGMVDHLAGVLGTTCPRRDELEIAIEVRNEIAHHFPRPGRAAKNLPEWYTVVQQRGLFITTGHVDVDFNLSQKLGSFKLAYWVNEVVTETVADLLRDSEHAIAVSHSGQGSNFRLLLQGVPSPDSLKPIEDRPR